MSSRSCSSCGATIPNTNYCPECETCEPADLLAEETTNPEEFTTWLSTVAGFAEHPSITFDALRSNYDKYDRPLGDFLFEHERPIALCGSSGVVVDDYGDRSWKLTAGFLKAGHLLLTNKRVLIILPVHDGDRRLSRQQSKIGTAEVISISHRSVVAVERVEKLRRDRIRLETIDGYVYAIRAYEVTEQLLREIIDRLQELVSTHESSHSRTARIRKNVDAAVANSKSVEDVLQAVSDEFAATDEKTIFDNVVADAESLEELVHGLNALPGIRHRQSDIAGDTPDRTIVPFRSPDTSFKNNIEYTLRNADPAEVGLYTIAAGILLGGYAVTAPFSTVAGLAAITAGGATTGAYASSHPDSFWGRIDPIALVLRARTQGSRWEQSAIPRSGAVGTMIGALGYAAEEEVSEEYATWITNVDIDAVRRWAERGVREAERNDSIESQWAAAALGGGFGLATGYMDADERLDELKPLLDDDLFHDMANELAK